AVQIQIMDVTTRKRAEKKLFESEKQLSLIYDTVGDVLFYLIVESDDCFRFRSVNQAFLDATGLDRDQIVGKPVNEVIPEPSLPMILDNYKKAIEEKRIVRWEETTEYPSGVKVGDVCIAPIFKDGICTHLVGSVHDITDRKSLEERLQSERNEFNSILEELPIGVTVLDTKDKVVYINPISIEIDGFKTNTDSLMGKNVRSIHPKHTLPTIEKLLADFKSGRKTHFSREAKRGKRTVEISYHTIRSEIGKYQGLTRLVSDITERKIAEKRITRLSRIFEESLNEIYLFDADNLIFTHVNSAAQQNLGYTMEELKNFTPLTLKPEFTVESFSKLIDPLKKGEKQKIIFETVHKRKDKSLYNVEVHLQLLTFENETLFAAIILDITERKQAEDALKESEAKFRGVIEESNDGIYVLQDDRFKFINPRFTEITGYELKEISSSNFDFKILFTDKGLEVLEEREALRIQGVEPPTRYIFEGLRKDGQRRDLEVSVTLIDWQGQPATLGIVSDVTERIQNQIALEKAFEDAKQGEKVKSLFMANMSHEIRTPLNTILGFTDLVEETTRDLLSEEEKTFFNVISTSGKRLMRTVHEILDISQLDAGTVVIVKEVFNLVPMIQEMVHGMRIQAEEKQLDLTFHSTRKEILVYADKEGITHSISNIIDNAIKYTDEGSITLSLRQKSRKAILTIKDTGIGMSKEYLNNLFEAFTQESEGYTKDYQGIGLGSAIVKGHLDLNEVDISVESTKGKGTTFTLTFPEPNKISNKTKNVKNSNENKDS
ncbi:MAG: PAS domain S-box protein, partial [Fidelibacterota bacterium]